LEIRNIAGDDSEMMFECRRRNHTVDNRPGIGHMQSSATQGDRGTYHQDPINKRGEDKVVKPPIKIAPLHRIPTRNAEHTDFNFVRLSTDRYMSSGGVALTTRRTVDRPCPAGAWLTTHWCRPNTSIELNRPWAGVPGTWRLKIEIARLIVAQQVEHCDPTPLQPPKIFVLHQHISRATAVGDHDGALIGGALGLADIVIEFAA